MRGPGESYSDAILRLVKMEGTCAPVKDKLQRSGRPIPVATLRLTANPPRRLSSVPSDYARRKELWIRSGLWLSFNEGPFVTLGVKSLGLLPLAREGDT